MNKKPIYLAALALAFASATPVIPRAAHACGGYGVASETAVRAVHRYVYALRTNASEVAAAMWVAGAHASRPASAGGCCSPPVVRPVTPEAWVRDRLGDRTYSIERVDAPVEVNGDEVRVDVHSVIDRAPAVETLTLRYVAGRWRIAGLSSRWA